MENSRTAWKNDVSPEGSGVCPAFTGSGVRFRGAAVLTTPRTERRGLSASREDWRGDEGSMIGPISLPLIGVNTIVERRTLAGRKPGRAGTAETGAVSDRGRIGATWRLNAVRREDGAGLSGGGRGRGESGYQ